MGEWVENTVLLSSCGNATEAVLSSWEKQEAFQWQRSFLKPVCKFLLNMRQLLFYEGLQVGQIRKLLQAWVFPSTRLTVLTNTKPLLISEISSEKLTTWEPTYPGAQSAECVWPHMVSFTKIMVTLKIQSFPGVYMLSILIFILHFHKELSRL